MEHDPNTEIDLWELLRNNWAFFKRRMAVILIFFLIGLLFSLSNFITQPLKYKSFFRKELIAQSSVVSNEILSEIINAIPIHIKNNDASGFPELKHLQGKIEANKYKDTRLKLIIEVFDTSEVTPALQALETHISSTPALKEKFDFNKKQQQQLLTALNNQLAAQDSTKINSGNSHYIELLEKKQLVEKQFTQGKIVEFIAINTQPVPMNNARAGILNILGYSFLGLVLGAITGWFLDIIKRIK